VKRGIHILPIEVRFGDCDPAGIIYFPRYFDFFHQAMESWFPRHLGLGYESLIRGQRLGFPAVHTEADFRRPSRFGERVEVAMRVLAVGGSSITFGYEVSGPEGELRATGRSVCVVMDLDPNSPTHERAVPIPSDLRVRIEAFGVGSEAGPEG